MSNPYALLNVYIVWHPDSQDRCQPLAEALYLTLHRDPDRIFSGGIGIPTYFRGVNAPGQKAPLDIDLEAARHSVVIVLVDDVLVVDRDWEQYIAALYQKTFNSNQQHLLVPVAVSANAGNLQAGISTANFINLYKFREENHKTTLIHYAAHLLARLLANRPGQHPADSGLGSLPVKLFISYTERDARALLLAQALKGTVDGTQMDRFFDKVDIGSGHDFTEAIKRNIKESAVIAIRSDQYSLSPWCRKEVVYAKQQHRPMIVVDALQQQENRSFPYLSNIPAIRFDLNTPLEAPLAAETSRKLQAIIDFALLEALRFFYLQKHFRHLQTLAALPDGAVTLSRPPEERDLKQPPLKDIVIYPDPPLGSEEHEELGQNGVSLHTPTSYRGSGKPDGFSGNPAIGISISEPDPGELPTLGLSHAHLQNAMLDIARHCLAKGARLVYGGDLRPNGFTENLLGLVRYHNDALLPTFLPLQNYLAWHLIPTLDVAWEAKNRAVLEVCKVSLPADLVPAGCPAAVLPSGYPQEITPYIRARCLSQMRAELVANTSARIMLGGKTVGYSGKYPGLVEEALLTLAAQQPLYLLGGYGGAARAIIQALQGEQPRELTAEYQLGQPDYQDLVKDYNWEIRTVQPAIEPIDYAVITATFNNYGVAALRNGLDAQENQVLFTSVNHEEVVGLILQGLAAIKAGE